MLWFTCNCPLFPYMMRFLNGSFHVGGVAGVLLDAELLHCLASEAAQV